ncbi:MAG: ATP-binding cassette domain-containing protein, partial [Candidatus Micrarchaeaceae archaeon]
PEKIEAAARLAQIHDDIVAMPMAYHTLVGDMGSTLSGGQKQRVFLARALYKQPKVLVLDEATNQLDVRCEQKISDALQYLAITSVLVAHRTETMRAADHVLVCIKSRITEAKLKETFQLSRIGQTTYSDQDHAKDEAEQTG